MPLRLARYCPPKRHRWSAVKGQSLGRFSPSLHSDWVGVGKGDRRQYDMPLNISATLSRCISLESMGRIRSATWTLSLLYRIYWKVTIYLSISRPIRCAEMMCWDKRCRDVNNSTASMMIDSTEKNEKWFIVTNTDIGLHDWFWWFLALTTHCI